MFECYGCQAQLPLPVPQQLSCIGLLQHGIHMDPGWASSIGYASGKPEFMLFDHVWSLARKYTPEQMQWCSSFRSFDICCCCNGPQIPPFRFLSCQTWFLTWLLLGEASKAQLIHLYDGSPYSSFSIGTQRCKSNDKIRRVFIDHLNLGRGVRLWILSRARTRSISIDTSHMVDRQWKWQAHTTSIYTPCPLITKYIAKCLLSGHRHFCERLVPGLPLPFVTSSRGAEGW